MRYRTEVEQEFGTTAAHKVSTQPSEIQVASAPELVMNLACIYSSCFLFTVPSERTNPGAVTARTPHCGSSAEAGLRETLHLPVKTTAVVNTVIFRGQTRQPQQVSLTISTSVYILSMFV